MTRIKKGERFRSFQEFIDENLNLKYKTVRYDCSKAKIHVKTTTARETKTGKCGCNSYISVDQRKVDGIDVLENVQVIEGHNHPLSSDLFSHMPKQRQKLINENQEQLESFFTTKSNIASIQTKVCSEKGGIITRRDLYNAKVKWIAKKTNMKTNWLSWWKKWPLLNIP